MDDLYRHSSWHAPWLSRFARTLQEAFDGKLPISVKSPALVSIPEPDTDYLGAVFCQFDSRSHQPMGGISISRALEVLCPSQIPIVIGGPDTPRYMGDGYRYALGTLHQSVKLLYHAKEFIGVDSGMAHLAGVLDAPSVIINNAELDSVQRFFAGYPNSRVLDGRILIGR